jgi:hypothetical protein
MTDDERNDPEEGVCTGCWNARQECVCDPPDPTCRNCDERTTNSLCADCLNKAYERRAAILAAEYGERSDR